jgi:hypothetical protein
MSEIKVHTHTEPRAKLQSCVFYLLSFSTATVKHDWNLMLTICVGLQDLTAVAVKITRL